MGRPDQIRGFTKRSVSAKMQPSVQSGCLLAHYEPQDLPSSSHEYRAWSLQAANAVTAVCCATTGLIPHSASGVLPRRQRACRPDSAMKVRPVKALSSWFLGLLSIWLRRGIVGGAALVIGAAFWYTWQFIEPAPPGRFVMATGAPDGAYHRYGIALKDVVAEWGHHKPGQADASNPSQSFPLTHTKLKSEE